MSWIDGLTHRLGRLVQPNAFRRDLEEEMQFHSDLDALQRRDSRRFGNRTYYKEETRRMTWLAAFDSLRQDIDYAWRSITRSPGFTALAVLTLALGVGATAALFSFIDRLYLRSPSGIADPASLRRVWVRHFNTFDGVSFASQSMSYRRAEALAQAVSDSTQIATYYTDNELRQGSGRAAPKLRGTYVSAHYFDVVGTRPALGRFFSAGEDRLGFPTPVAIVSHRFWREHLKADSNIIGKPLLIGRERHEIIGVAQPSFTGLDLSASDVWLPWSTFPNPSYVKVPWWRVDQLQFLNVVIRVPPTFAAPEFEQRATALLRAAHRMEITIAGDSLLQVDVGPIIEARGPAEPGPELQISTRLTAVAAVVLLIACANIINLLLARAVDRRREIAVRLALGISRARLIRLVVLESVLLALVAAVAALFAGWWGGTLMRALLLPNVRWIESALNWRLTAFVVAIALPAGALAGLVPAVQASRPQLTGALKAGASGDDTKGGSKIRAGLLVMQAALSVLLLVGAGLFVRSLVNVRGLDIGFDKGRLLFGEARYEDGLAPPNAVLDQKMRDAESLLLHQPGIEIVARAGFKPLNSLAFMDFYFGNDSARSLGPRTPAASPVSRNFFEATGIRILRGTTFSATESGRSGAEIVLNEAAAQVLWPGRDAVGECIRFDRSTNAECYRVVGVVENVHGMQVIEDQVWAQYYLPLDHMPQAERRWIGRTLIVRAAPGGMQAAGSATIAVLRRAFPGVDLAVTPMTNDLEPEYRPWKLGALLFSAFGLLALIVALVGIYSSVAYSVGQRTREFGVRIALGARITHILGRVVGTGLRSVVLGVVLGVILSVAAGRVIGSLLYNVKPHDPIVLLVVAVAILTVAALAALIPALRATRVDPVTSLRAE